MNAAQEALAQRHPEEYAELVAEHLGDTTPSETLEELAARSTANSRRSPTTLTSKEQQ